LLLAIRTFVYPLLFAVALIVAFVFGTIEVNGLIGVALFALLAQYTSWNLEQVPRRISAYLVFLLLLALVLLGFTIGSHLWPGFHNPLLIAQTSDPGMSQARYFSVDKALVGYILLFYVTKPSLRVNRSVKSWRLSILFTVVIAGIALLFLIPSALLLNVVSWRPHLSSVWLVWLSYNLLVTCVVEEAFFRGLIQNALEYSLSKRTAKAPVSALMITSVLFALAHIGAGLTYALLSGVAAAFYGYAYQQSGRLSVAIVVHFLVNAGVYLTTV